MNQGILLIDDDRAHRQIVKRIVARAGLPVTVFEADSLSSGFTALQQHEVVQHLRVIVVDLNLKDGQGTLLLSEVKRSKPHGAERTLPVIILSTSPLDGDRERCQELGADSYLVKDDDLLRFSAELIRHLTHFLKG